MASNGCRSGVTTRDVTCEILGLFEKPGRLEICSRLDIMKNLSMQMVLKHCNGLPREVVESPSLEVCKRCVDMVLTDVGRDRLNRSHLQLDATIPKLFSNLNNCVVLCL